MTKARPGLNRLSAPPCAVDSVLDYLHSPGPAIDAGVSFGAQMKPRRLLRIETIRPPTEGAAAARAITKARAKADSMSAARAFQLLGVLDVENRLAAGASPMMMGKPCRRSRSIETPVQPGQVECRATRDDCVLALGNRQSGNIIAIGRWPLHIEGPIRDRISRRPERQYPHIHRPPHRALFIRLCIADLNRLAGRVLRVAVLMRLRIFLHGA